MSKKNVIENETELKAIHSQTQDNAKKLVYRAISTWVQKSARILFSTDPSVRYVTCG